MKINKGIIISIALLIPLLFGCSKDDVPIQDTVRILAIGTSFSEDAIEQNLQEIGKADDHLLIIGNMYIGGCSLETHVKNARENAEAYSYRKIGSDGKRK